MDKEQKLICPACRQEYQDENGCPWCGCPKNYLLWPDTGIPPELQSEYSLVGRTQRGVQDGYLLQKEAGEERYVFMNIPADEPHKAEALLKEKEDPHDVLPELIKVQPPEAGKDGYYIFRYPTGIWLRDWLERENPIDAEQAERIGLHLEKRMKALNDSGFHFGLRGIEDIFVDNGTIRLYGFGNGAADDDVPAARQIMERLKKGYEKESNDNKRQRTFQFKPVYLLPAIAAVAAVVLVLVRFLH